MIELRHDTLRFCFPEVHERARLSITLQRTLRIPDDGTDYPLPPGLGDFPLRHVDDFAARVPADWQRHGGVMLPMYQSEALWLNLSSGYPFAVKVATGKINAVTGEDWTDGIHRDPQDYMVSPGQPWLDGYCFEEGMIRQFVAMPLGSGYTVEEQITGEPEHGGLQIVAYPMKAEAFEKIKKTMPDSLITGEHMIGNLAFLACAAAPMGLAAGGRMRQEIFEDTHDFDVWDTRASSRCFVHIANSLAWRAITGEDPPTTPLTSAQYNSYGLPWFDYYDSDLQALSGAAKFAGVKSVHQMGAATGEQPLPENESVVPGPTVRLGPSGGRVREGEF